MENETVMLIKYMFCNDVCFTLVKMFVYWKDPVKKIKNSLLFLVARSGPIPGSQRILFKLMRRNKM